MGWAVGIRDDRFIGYGVPATCDFPGCGKRIDRGLAYLCGDGYFDTCGLFFCGEHKPYARWEGAHLGNVCERCHDDLPAFTPTPDTQEWAEHVLTDPSWAEWRRDEPEWARRLEFIRRGSVVGADPADVAETAVRSEGLD